MGIVEKYKVYEVKGRDGRVQTRMIRLPKSIKAGRSATIAGDRLLIVDPRGEIEADELLTFFENEIEHKFWDWMEKRVSEKDEEVAE